MNNKTFYIIFAIAMIAMFSEATTGKRLTHYDMAIQDAQCKGKCVEAKAFSHHKWIGQSFTMR